MVILMHISLQTSTKDYSLGIYAINTAITFSETTLPGVLSVFIMFSIIKSFYFFVRSKFNIYFYSRKFGVFSWFTPEQERTIAKQL